MSITSYNASKLRCHAQSTPDAPVMCQSESCGAWVINRVKYVCPNCGMEFAGKYGISGGHGSGKLRERKTGPNGEYIPQVLRSIPCMTPFTELTKVTLGRCGKVK